MIDEVFFVIPTLGGIFTKHAKKRPTEDPSYRRDDKNSILYLNS